MCNKISDDCLSSFHWLFYIWTLLQFIRVKLYYEIYGFLDDVYYPVYCPHTAFEYFLWPSFFWWVIKFKDLKPLWTLHCLTSPAFSGENTLSKCKFDLQLFQRFARFFFDHVQFFVEKNEKFNVYQQSNWTIR